MLAHNNLNLAREYLTSIPRAGAYGKITYEARSAESVGIIISYPTVACRVIIGLQEPMTQGALLFY